MSMTRQVVIAVFAGLLVGIAISSRGAGTLIGLTSFAEVTGSLWVNAIRMTVLPLVVSLLIVAIGSAADSGILGRLGGRTLLLFIMLLGEGLSLVWFSSMNTIWLVVLSMTVFGLFTHMACGATYALVPFIDRKALGGVAGIIGAGGNVGAVAAGFLMKGVGDAQQTLMILGIFVTVSAVCALLVRFSPDVLEKEGKAFHEAHAERKAEIALQRSRMSADPQSVAATA